jgi:uncharacterized protein
MGLLRLSRRLAGSPHPLIAALLIYGNGSAWLSTREGKEISLSFNWWHMAMLAGTLVWAAAERVSHRELGLAGDRVRGSIVLGSMLGGFIVALIRVLFLLPVVARRAWLPEFRGLTNLALLRALAAQFLFGSALFEEVAFRGLLHAKLTQAVGPARALLLGSGVFTLWHAIIVWHNLRRLKPGRLLFPLFYGGALSALFLIGLLLGWLRLTTGHLVGSVILHWLMLVGMAFSVSRVREEHEQEREAAAERISAPET